MLCRSYGSCEMKKNPPFVAIFIPLLPCFNLLLTQLTLFMILSFCFFSFVRQQILLCYYFLIINVLAIARAQFSPIKID